MEHLKLPFVDAAVVGNAYFATPVPGGSLRLRIDFARTIRAGEYDGLRLATIHQDRGELDAVSLRFEDHKTFDHRDAARGCSPLESGYGTIYEFRDRVPTGCHGKAPTPTDCATPSSSTRPYGSPAPGRRPHRPVPRAALPGRPRPRLPPATGAAPADPPRPSHCTLLILFFLQEFLLAHPPCPLPSPLPPQRPAPSPGPQPRRPRRPSRRPSPPPLPPRPLNPKRAVSLFQPASGVRQLG